MGDLKVFASSVIVEEEKLSEKIENQSLIVLIMRYEDVQIKEFPVENGGKITIIRGGINKPKSYLDNVVSEYVGNVLHNQFIEIYLDNPYVRVIVTGINDFNYNVLDTDIFHLNENR